MPVGVSPDPDMTDGSPVTESTGEPSRRLSALAIVIAVAVALLVLAAVGAGIYFLTAGGDEDPPAAANPAFTSTPAAVPPTSEPVVPDPSTFEPPPQPEPPPEPEPEPAEPEAGAVTAVAEQAVAAINADDPEAMRRVSCDPEAIGPADSTPPEARVELVSTPELTGDTATVELRVTIGDQSAVTPLPLRKVDGTWCVD
jgi:hypothetical protein